MKKFICKANGAEQALTYGAAQEQFELAGKPFTAGVAEVRPFVYSVLIDGASMEVRVSVETPDSYRVTMDEAEFSIDVIDKRKWSRGGASAQVTGSRRVSAPMPGKVVRLLVSEGQAVKAGQGLVVIEAMKMQNEIKSPKVGQVKSISISEGQTLAAGQEIIVIE